MKPETTEPCDGTRLPIIGRTIRFLYRDRGGEESDRTVIPGEIRFGPCAGHSDPQWVMRAYDVDMGAYRNFAMQNMQEVQDV